MGNLTSPYISSRFTLTPDTASDWMLNCTEITGCVSGGGQPEIIEIDPRMLGERFIWNSGGVTMKIEDVSKKTKWIERQKKRQKKQRRPHLDFADVPYKQLTRGLERVFALRSCEGDVEDTFRHGHFEDDFVDGSSHCGLWADGYVEAAATSSLTERDLVSGEKATNESAVDVSIPDTYPVFFLFLIIYSRGRRSGPSRCCCCSPDVNWNSDMVLVLAAADVIGHKTEVAVGRNEREHFLRLPSTETDTRMKGDVVE